jgi:protein-L-isoaspartate O-methyltransferase
MTNEFLDDFEKIKRLMLGFSAFQTLVSASNFNLFQKLSEKPGMTRSEISKIIGISDHATRLLLLGCCTYDLLTRKEESYYNTSMSEYFLTENTVFPISAFIKYCDVVNYKAFQFLTDSLKSEKNLGLQTIPGTGDSLYKRLAQSPDLEKMFQDAMAPKNKESRSLFFATTEFGDVKNLLDVGGGPGYIASLLKNEYQNLKITIFDLPTVCEKAENRFSENNLKGLSTHPGDFFTDPFPIGYDAILFSHLLEIFSEDKIIHLLTKSFEALPKGGKLFIYGMGCDNNESGGDMAAWGSLYFFLLASGEGMMYPASDYCKWLKNIGFSEVIDRKNEFENIIIIATK